VASIAMAQALPIVQAAIVARLAPLVGLDAQGLPRCYWQRAPIAADVQPDPGTIVFQSQDRGGREEAYLGACGWAGLIAIKVYATQADRVDALLGQVEAAMAGIVAGTGQLSIVGVAPLTLPVDRGEAAGLLYSLTLMP